MNRFTELVNRIPMRVLWWVTVFAAIAGSIVFGWIATIVPNP